MDHWVSDLIQSRVSRCQVPPTGSESAAARGVRPQSGAVGGWLGANSTDKSATAHVAFDSPHSVKILYLNRRRPKESDCSRIVEVRKGA